MAKKLMGRKRGMTQRFDEQGNLVACTVIEVTPNLVTQIKTQDVDGYTAIQTAFDPIKAKDERRALRLAGKPRAGHFKKAGVGLYRHLMEARVDDVEEIKLGDELKADLFEVGALVDVSGTTQGKGFQGVMKLHGFSGGPGSHGSGFHRRAGSTGMRSTPGRCLPGSPRASQMGNRQRTVQNLKVIAVDVEQGVILVKGSIPGHTGSMVVIGPSVKKTK